MTAEQSSIYDVVLSPLHYELKEFMEEVIPTEEEEIHLQDLTSIIDECVVDLLGQRANVQRFGSCATGLSTHASDLDLVILNVVRVHSKGFRVEQRARAVKILYKLAQQLARSQVIQLAQMKVIARARVPVLKIGTKQGRNIDVTLNNKAGVKAANYMRETLGEFPSSVAVILVLKSMLKQAGLNDVSQGGLGGYALTAMVLAHCRELRKLGRPDLDYGDLLLGFLEKFGFNFDYIRQAVSARRGETVKKSVLEKETLEWIRDTDGWEGRTNGKPRLFVEDPLTGMNVAKGTHCFRDVQKLFRRSYGLLDTASVSEGLMLPHILDIPAALRRSGPFKRVRHQRRTVKREAPNREKARQDVKEFKQRLNRLKQNSNPEKMKRVRPQNVMSISSTIVLSTASTILS